MAGEKMTGKGAAADFLANRMKVYISYFPTVAIVCRHDQGNLQKRVHWGLQFQRLEQRQKVAAMAVGTRS